MSEEHSLKAEIYRRLAAGPGAGVTRSKKAPENIRCKESRLVKHLYDIIIIIIRMSFVGYVCYVFTVAAIVKVLLLCRRILASATAGGSTAPATISKHDLPQPGSDSVARASGKNIN